MTVTALLAALSYFICYGGNWLLGQCMIERPIVVGAVTGLLLGDLPTGLIMGASLEAIFMGSVKRLLQFLLSHLQQCKQLMPMQL